MELKAKVIKEIVENRKKGVSAKNGKNWCSTEFLVEHEYESQYPRKTVIGFFQSGEDKPIVKEAIEKLKAGQIATFHLNIDASEYNGKWYNQIRCWKIDLFDSPIETPTDAAAVFTPPTDNSDTGKQGVESGADDLPF